MINKIQMKAEVLGPPFVNRREPFNSQSFFSQKVLQMIQEHTRPQINFNEFVTILARHDIKFYSPQQFKKMSKIFINSMNSLPLKQPFEYIEMHSKQDVSLHHQVLMIRVLNKKLNLSINQLLHTNQQLPHTTEKCLRDFVITMKKRYGSEINWFKVVGGMTVSVSIEQTSFKENIEQIMKHTIHSQCSQRLVQLFEQPKQKIISWNRFMSVVNGCVKKVSQSLRARQKSIKPVKCHTQPTDQSNTSMVTIKSAFISTFKQSDFIKQQKRKSTPSKAFFWSRCKTQPCEQFILPLQIKRFMIQDRRSISTSFNDHNLVQNKDANYSKLSSISFRTSVAGKRNKNIRSWMNDFNSKRG